MLSGLTAANRRSKGFSLTEMLVVVAVIGIITSIAIQAIGNLSDTARETVARGNAQQLDTLSGTLSGLGVAHVIPDSLGGVEATCRLLKEGIVLSEGPMSGSFYGMPSLPEKRIPAASEYLKVAYEQSYVLRMRYRGNANP